MTCNALGIFSFIAVIINFPAWPFLPAAVLLHQSERSGHRLQSEAAGPDLRQAAGLRGREVQGRLLGGV